jgi:hypothetical protein
MSVVKDIFAKAKENARARKIARGERLKETFPFNLLKDVWRGVTGEPRN